MDTLAVIYSYLLAFGFTTVALVYLLKVPYWITGEKPLVDLYYYTNYTTNIPLDILLISVYLAFAHFLSNRIGIESWYFQIMMVVVTTVLISGSFYWYFTSKPKTSDFFSKWFHTVGYNAVIYDIILVSTTFVVYQYLLSKFNKKNT